VFAGFTGASTAGLWVGQRNLIHNETQALQSSASSIQASLRANQSAKAMADGADEIEQLQLELLVHSSHRSRLWIEQPDGRLILPQREHLKISDTALGAAMQSNPERVVGRQDGVRVWLMAYVYDPNRGRYRDTNQKCALTRMEALISEMTMILEQLPNNTKVRITAFSSSGYRNNKGWSESSSGLARLGDDGKRDSAIEFVNILDDEKVTSWCGNDP
jgi:hypothetical protein